MTWMLVFVALGQLNSLAMAWTGIASTLLVHKSASVSLLQAAVGYFLTWFVTYNLYITRRLWLPLRWRKLTAADPEAKSLRFSQSLWRALTPESFPLWRFVLPAFFDLQGNFLVVTAFHYTSILSIQLVDAAIIPFVLMFSLLLLRHIPLVQEVLGIFLALAGLGVVITLELQGSISNDPTPPTDPLKGDGLCIAGVFCYALANVLGEMLIKARTSATSEKIIVALQDSSMSSVKYDSYESSEDVLDKRMTKEFDKTCLRLLEQPIPVCCCDKPHQPYSKTHQNTSWKRVGPLSWRWSINLLPKTHRIPSIIEVLLEYQAFMHMLAFAMSLIQLFAFQYSSLKAASTTFDGPVIGYYFLFATSVGIQYTTMSILFAFRSALFSNMSLLTSDVFGALLNFLVFHISPTYYYLIACLLILLGVLIYDGGILIIAKWFH